MKVHTHLVQGNSSTNSSAKWNSQMRQQQSLPPGDPWLLPLLRKITSPHFLSLLSKEESCCCLDYILQQLHAFSLFDYEISEHLVILSECLLTVNLVVVADHSVNHEEVWHVCGCDGWKGQEPLALYQIIASTSTIKHGWHCHDCGDSHDKGSEASLCLPNAEALVIVEQIGFFLNSARFLLTKESSQLLLTLQKGVNLSQSSSILSAE